MESVALELEVMFLFLPLRILCGKCCLPNKDHLLTISSQALHSIDSVMEILNNYNLKDLSHDLILDGSRSFYDKIPNEFESPVVVDYPFPIESPCKNIDNSILKDFFEYTTGDRETNYARREFKSMKDDICNQDFDTHAVLPEFLINYIQNEEKEEVNYGFNIQHSYGTLEKFYNDNELCLIRPNIENNLEICKPRQPNKKIILQWSCTDPIQSIKNMNRRYSNSFSIRGQNNVYLIDIDNDLHIKINLKLKCDIGYMDETSNQFKETELALMDAKTKLKLFDLEKQHILSSYSKEDLQFDSEPRFLKMNYLTENMLMIMTDKHIKLLDNRCKDPAQDTEIRLHKCDILLDFTSDKSKDCIPNEVYLSSKHAFFIYDIRGESVNDYIHHNLRFPPCFINCFEGTDAKLVTLFGQSSSEAALFGTSSPYSLPYHLNTLQETVEQCKSRKSLPVIPNLEKRLNFPITGVQIVPNKDDVSIYFSNLFGEIFRQDVLLKSFRSGEPFEKMHEWLMEIYEIDDPDLNMVHLANARAAFESNTDFNDVDLFNHYEKSNVHDFLDDEDFDFTKWNVENFDQIWDDDNDIRDFGFLESKPGDFKVEEWIKNTNFENDFE